MCVSSAGQLLVLGSSKPAPAADLVEKKFAKDSERHEKLCWAGWGTDKT